MPNLFNISPVFISPVFAPADGAGGGGAPKRTATERAFNSFVKAVGRDTKAKDRAEAARRKAIGDTFTAMAENEEDQDLLRRVFIGFEVNASKANRKHIASHPLRPAGVDAPVEKRLAEIAAAKAEAERKAREAREAEEARRRACEARSAGDDDESDPDDGADAPA